MTFFSVIIPLFNKENFIKETLNSLLNQTFKNFEVIIVNDGSTDESLKKVESFEDERIRIFNQKNKGVTITRNRAVDKAEGKWMAFLDADDIWKPNHLLELKKCVDKLPKADLVSNAYKIRLQNQFIKIPSYSKTIPNKIDYIQNYLEYCFIDPLFWTSSIAVRKEKFTEIGGFDENLKTGEDLDLMIRFCQKHKIGYNPIHTITYNRITENNLTDALHLTEKKKYIDKHKNEESKDPVLKKYLDINRYSLALQAKRSYQKDLYRLTLSDINKANLSSKQLFLIKFPGYILNHLKRFQLLLMNAGIYKSAFT